MPRPPNAPAYEDDFVAWLEDQARHAQRGKIDALDLENIAEELEGMARSDRREIGNRLTVLLIHLLKYVLQSQRRSRSWIGTIGEQRRCIYSIIHDSPSLRSFPGTVLNECYAEARAGCADETGVPESRIPEECPFELRLILDPRWLPGQEQ